MQDRSHKRFCRPLPGEDAIAGTQSSKRSHALQLLLVSALILLLSGFQTAQAQQTEKLVDESMLSALYSNYGEAAYLRGLHLSQLLERLRRAGTRTKLLEVNRFFNRFNYRSDAVLWQTRDHWATPLQFLGKHGGDCEDFVISKYFALRSIGIKVAQLSIIYAKSTDGRKPHLVLAYQDSTGSVALILDERSSAVRPATEHKGLIPVYGFNESSIFILKPNFMPGQALPTDKVRNSKWARLLAAVRGHQAEFLIASRLQPKFGG